MRPTTAAFARAAGENVGRIAPERLGIGVAQVAGREPDIGKHTGVELCQRRGLAAVFEGARDAANAENQTREDKSKTRPQIGNGARELKRGGYNQSPIGDGSVKLASESPSEHPIPRPVCDFSEYGGELLISETNVFNLIDQRH